MLVYKYNLLNKWFCVFKLYKKSTFLKQTFHYFLLNKILNIQRNFINVTCENAK